MIVDYPWSKPGGGALKAAGVQGVMRYLSHDTTKTLQRPEADDLAAHGIPMGVVFEDMAQRALDGYSAGMNDAQVALQMAAGQRNGYSDLAMPAGRPIYFAADFDSQWPDIAPYYAGAAKILGQDRVGIYGGLAAVTGAANSGYRWLWQTVAWSHGQWHPKATMRQQLGEVTINHVQCDVNDHQQDDWGQWVPGGEDLVLDPQTIAQLKQIISDSVWMHTENDADGSGPVRMGAVMAWMDKVHENHAKAIADLKADVDAIKAQLPPKP
jgi:hypothetical protein